ncbi:MAG TPA: sulfur carrier protein ThiS [Actinomycetota bacterium]|nr:sulfur carrier protein ThiS [Actinomycetota bacterium]
MKLIVNGKETFSDAASIPELLRSLDVTDPRGVAVAVNGEVIARSSWSEVRLNEGERVEVLRAVQGG